VRMYGHRTLHATLAYMGAKTRQWGA
jgi:hypothetical protein